MALELCSWGPRGGLFFVLGSAVPGRPASSSGDEIDRELDRATKQCRLKVLVVLGAADADSIARSTYVLYEGGPTTRDVVIAIGHADGSVAWCVTDALIPQDEAPLRAILDGAQRELRAGSPANALRAIAASLPDLR